MAAEYGQTTGRADDGVWLRMEARTNREGQTAPVVAVRVDMPDAVVDGVTLRPNPVREALTAYSDAQAAWEAANAECERCFNGSRWAFDNAKAAEVAARATRDAALVNLNVALRAVRGA